MADKPVVIKKNVSLKLPSELVRDLDQMAHAEHRSRNSMVTIKLDEVVRDYRATRQDEKPETVNG